MIDRIYIEKEIEDHQRVQKIINRFPRARKIMIDRYAEVFNRRGQNFRLQKKKPALILAKKHDNFVIKAPEGFGIGSYHNYYFSHMYNCIYDCRYCFLQGLYQSAHYVLFVNYEDFLSQIKKTINDNQDQDVYFFSGYDGDSMALDSVTGFCDYFTNEFSQLNRAWLELRTKSVQIQSLIKTPVQKKVVVSWSFTPQCVSVELENQVPSVASRIKAMKEVANLGWPIGIRLDPLIYHERWQVSYRELIKEIFSSIKRESVHSVSTGPLRFPKHVYSKINKLYSDEKLFALSLQTNGPLVSYSSDIENTMNDFCHEELLKYVDSDQFFTCTPESVHGV